MNAPTSRTSGLPQRRQERATAMNIRAGCRRSTPAQIARNSDGLSLQVGAGDVAGEVRAEVALLDDPVEAGERLALGDQLGDAALARRRGLGLAVGLPEA